MIGIEGSSNFAQKNRAVLYNFPFTALRAPKKIPIINTSEPY
jgi:hypothetical protein